ncbi:TetR/AcrR family transcriptional regulator [Micromonospora endophytica]|uniref:TetR family transcriptional regulator n=1 Tax=Micromonospora endophytica TaxID=515350 RepID=A0A2W2CPW0_9ACTN|nr:TetR/AcrR family transcriptional regulator [Micromonospora endophytica]PZG00613.1 TetR family transcriptional regulator [Micromonospora endophytica]RIW51440.1 TetR/AcrR family transcriptional regulator [Micromonospora endophytica]BCJ62160.1 TetR family transcriptional regulator [Micromonospora endophytica]
MAAPRPTRQFPDQPLPPPGPRATTVSRPGGRSSSVRRRVLDAVRTHLAEHGYDALSVDAVADRSGVHRTTVYRRWRDVGGLLADALTEAIDDTWSPTDTGTLDGDLHAVNREVYAALTAEPPVTAALIAASFRSEQAAAALRSFWADRYDRCAAIVHRAVDRREIPAGTDPRRLLVAATAPLYHELLLLRTLPDPRLAEQAAHATATAARAGAFTD